MIPHGPQHQRRARNIFTIFKIIPFCLFVFSFLVSFSNFFLIVKSSISPLIFISITYYYYFLKKKTFFFSLRQTPYIVFGWLLEVFLFVCFLIILFFLSFFLFPSAFL